MNDFANFVNNFVNNVYRGLWEGIKCLLTLIYSVFSSLNFINILGKYSLKKIRDTNII